MCQWLIVFENNDDIYLVFIKFIPAFCVSYSHPHGIDPRNCSEGSRCENETPASSIRTHRMPASNWHSPRELAEHVSPRLPGCSHVHPWEGPRQLLCSCRDPLGISWFQPIYMVRNFTFLSSECNLTPNRIGPRRPSK